MDTVLKWFYFPFAALLLVVGAVLLAMAHGNEAKGAGLLVTGASTTGLFYWLWSRAHKNTDHKGDGHVGSPP